MSFYILVDTSKLNHDNVDIKVRHLGQVIPHEVHKKHRGLLEVTFKPQTIGEYDVSVTCFNIEIQGDIYVLNINDLLWLLESVPPSPVTMSFSH